MADPRFSDDLLTRSFNRQHASATKQLRQALTEVQRLTARILDALDEDPSTAPLGGDGRALVHYAGEAASFAAAVEMAHQLAFLLPIPANTEES